MGGKKLHITDGFVILHCILDKKPELKYKYLHPIVVITKTYVTFAVFSLCFTCINLCSYESPSSSYHYYHNSVEEETEVQGS